VVRGLSALLAAYGLAAAYLLVASSLPAISDPDVAALASGSAGLVAFAVCALTLVSLHDAPVPLALVALGSLLLTVTLSTTDARTAEDLAKVTLAASIGLLLAWGLRGLPAAVIGVPLFVAAIDVWSVTTGPTSVLVSQHAAAADALSFRLPAWGSGAGGAQLGISDIVFLAFFAGSACRYGFRRQVTFPLLVLSLVGTLAVGIALNRVVPALPGLALALLLPNLDRLPRLLRPDAAAEPR
jgi:hypothetical protein